MAFKILDRGGIPGFPAGQVGLQELQFPFLLQPLGREALEGVTGAGGQVSGPASDEKEQRAGPAQGFSFPQDFFPCEEDFLSQKTSCPSRRPRRRVTAMGDGGFLRFRGFAWLRSWPFL